MLLTYLVVLGVVLLVLYGSFRALAGGEAVPAEDYRLVLERLCEFASARALELDSVLALPPTEALRVRSADERRAADPIVEAASSARKKLGGYHQQLARLEPDASGVERDQLEVVRTLLTAAVEDLAWACRLAESGTYLDNPAIRGAVDHLREHGAACLGSAAGMARRSSGAGDVVGPD